jgi:hypothetical protein
MKESDHLEGPGILRRIRLKHIYSKRFVSELKDERNLNANQYHICCAYNRGVLLVYCVKFRWKINAITRSQPWQQQEQLQIKL